MTTDKRNWLLMKTLQGTFTTDKSSMLLKRLCKHFAHKAPAEWVDHRGRVEFKPGLCLMNANESGLHIYFEAESESALDTLKMILETHLQRMARQDELGLVWREASTTDAFC